MISGYFFPLNVSTVPYENAWLLSLECYDHGDLIERISELMKSLGEENIRTYGISYYQNLPYEKVNPTFDLEVEGQNIRYIEHKLKEITGIRDFGTTPLLYESIVDKWCLYIEQFTTDIAVFQFRHSIKARMGEIFDEEWILKWVMSPEEVWAETGHTLKPEYQELYKEELFTNYGKMTLSLK